MLKNLKSLFIVEEEGGAPAPDRAAKPESPAKPSAAKPAAAPAPSTRAAAGRGQVTERFTDILLNAMDQNNLDGFDYLEYKRSLQSLQKMSMDEATRYQSAFAMAQTMGVDAPKLVQTAKHYLSVLQQEENKFRQAVDNQRQVQIGAKIDQQAKLEQTIQAKEAQIKQLQEEIEAHRREMEATKREVDEATVKVETTKNDFMASYQNLVDQINTDIDRMEKFLK